MTPLHDRRSSHVAREKGLAAIERPLQLGWSPGAADLKLVAGRMCCDSRLCCHLKLLLVMTVLSALAFIGFTDPGRAMDFAFNHRSVRSTTVKTLVDHSVHLTHELDRIGKQTGSEDAAGLLRALIESRTRDADRAIERLEKLLQILGNDVTADELLRQLIIEGIMDENLQSEHRALELEQVRASYQAMATEVHDMFDSSTRINQSNDSIQVDGENVSRTRELAVFDGSNWTNDRRLNAESDKPAMNFEIVLQRFRQVCNHNFRMTAIFRRRLFCFSIMLLVLIGMLSFMTPGGFGRYHPQAGMNRMHILAITHMLGTLVRHSWALQHSRCPQAGRWKGRRHIL